MITLRPYQLDAVEQVRRKVHDGARRTLLVLATGGGKTSCAAHLIQCALEKGKRSLFVAHRRELIEQCYGRLLTAGIAEANVGIIMAGDKRRRPHAPVQVASLDTLRARCKPPADLVIVDEAHRALAKSYRDLASEYPNAVHLGLTATPYRADGRGLGDAYDALVVVASPKELIAKSFLVEPIVYTVPEHELPDLSGVRVKGGDYDEKDLARAVDKQVLVGNIVEHWARRAGGMRTVVFAVSIEHSRHLAERFNAAGVASEHLDGWTPTAERDAILKRLEMGVTSVVSNVGVLCEGWDQPSVKCCILARPTKSTGLYLQQVGRILRPWTDPTTGETARAIILDHAGGAHEHGLPQDDREFSLEDKPNRRAGPRGEKPPPKARTCPQCFAVIPADAPSCSACGASLDVVLPSLPSEVEGELVELTEASVDTKRAEWEGLCATALERGYKPGWAFHRFKELFGVAPPRSFATPRRAGPATDEEKRAYLEHLEVTARTRGYRRGYIYVRYRERFGEAPQAHVDPPGAPSDETPVTSATPIAAGQLALPAPTATLPQPTSQEARDHDGCVPWEV
jgi:superfamily II DNA or RNA helicase